MMNGALVTGGTAGIGLASARALAATGRPVYVTGRDPAKLEAVEREPAGLRAIRADMAQIGDIEAVAGRLAADKVTLETLVVNAGTAEITRFGAVSEADFDRTFDLNVRGVFFTVQTLLPHLVDGASVILVGSICSIKGMADLSVYNASKAAVHALTRSWANDLRGRRIRVNTVSPGPIRTPLVERLQGGSAESLASFERWAAEASPAGRIGEPEDVAEVVRFLAEPESRHINGVELFVDGGLAQI